MKQKRKNETKKEMAILVHHTLVWKASQILYRVINCASIVFIFLLYKYLAKLNEALDHEHFLISDKQTEILDCIPCVMVIFLGTWQAQSSTRHSVKCTF